MRKLLVGAAIRRRFNEEQQQRILAVSLDPQRLDEMPVNEYVDLFVI